MLRWPFFRRSSSVKLFWSTEFVGVFGLGFEVEVLDPWTDSSSSGGGPDMLLFLPRLVVPGETAECSDQGGLRVPSDVSIT